MRRVDILFTGPTGTGKSTILGIVQGLLKDHTTISCTQISAHCLKVTWDQSEKELMQDAKRIKILEMIAIDMENDAEKFDGQAFNGRTVAEYNGNQGAAIAALAIILKSILMEANNVSNKE